MDERTKKRCDCSDGGGDDGGGVKLALYFVLYPYCFVVLKILRAGRAGVRAYLRDKTAYGRVNAVHCVNEYSVTVW